MYLEARFTTVIENNKLEKPSLVEWYAFKRACMLSKYKRFEWKKSLLVFFLASRSLENWKNVNNESHQKIHILAQISKSSKRTQNNTSLFNSIIVFLLSFIEIKEMSRKSLKSLCKNVFSRDYIRRLTKSLQFP